MSEIHVLHLIDGLTFGGAETLLRDVAAGLEKRGYRITVGYSTPGPFVQELANKGLTLKHIPRMGLIDPIFMLRMARLMRSDPPQIVHTHLFKSDFHGRLAARLAGVPVVVSTLHNNDSWANNWLLGHIYGATARWADRLIAVSSEVKAFHLKKTGVPSEKVQVIENGVDVAAFAGHEAEAGKIRQEFGITPDAPVMGIIGRLKPQKDLPTFLLAATEILREQPDARFLVVGDGPLRAELEELAKQLGLLPSLIFTGMRKDIPAILASSNILVLSSLWEGLPVILLEGMAAARPVVSTAVDGITGVAIPDKTALLTPPSAPAELAQACLKLIRNPQLAESMGNAGRERVLEYYSLDVMIDHISALYVDLLLSKGMTIPNSIRTSKLGS
jgi:glycosyltransferase involved in cell wall biosynthesis